MTVPITVSMFRGGNKGKFDALVVYTGEAQSNELAPVCPSYNLPQPRGAAPRMLHAHVLI